MKKTLLLCCSFMVLCAGVAGAAAGGLNLGWGDCGGLPSSLNRTFACNTNVGSNTLVCSFVAPCCLTAASSNEIVLDVQTAGATLPAWWGLKTSLCRPTALTQSPDFTGGPFTCLNYWGDQALAGLSADPAGNRLRIRIFVAIVVGYEHAIPEGTETYSDKVTISNIKSIGLGSCPGCLTGACIVLNSIRIDQPLGTPGGDKFVSAPAVRNWVTWQGGIGVDCYLATPARNTTWGSLKALYR